MQYSLIVAAGYVALLALIPVGIIIYNRRQTDTDRKISYVNAMTYALFWPAIILVYMMAGINVLYDKFSNID